jgi:translation elongation factor EF-Ts
MRPRIPTEEASRVVAAKSLRAKTGAGLLDCLKALSESCDDERRAIEWLRARMMLR